MKRDLLKVKRTPLFSIKKYYSQYSGRSDLRPSSHQSAKTIRKYIKMEHQQARSLLRNNLYKELKEELNN